MSLATTTQQRAHDALTRVETWSQRSRLRSVLVRVGVTLVGPVVVLVGAAMTVLPGPGLVVIAAGLALLALEYDWARRALRLMGRGLSQAREAALPKDGTVRRRALGLTAAGAFGVATFALTTVVTTFLTAHTVL